MSQFDQSGMRYKFEIDTTSLSELRAVRDELLLTREAFGKLSDDFRSRAAAAGTMAQRLQEMRKESRLSALAANDETAASAKATVALNARATAIRAYNAQFDKKFSADAKAAVAAERNFVAEKRSQSEAFQTARAHELVTKAIDKRSQSAATAAAFAERLADATIAEARAAGIATQAEIQLDNARKRLNTQRNIAEDPKIAAVTAEIQAFQRLNAARANLGAQQQIASDPQLRATTELANSIQRLNEAKASLATQKGIASEVETAEIRRQAEALGRLNTAEEELVALRADAQNPQLQSFKDEAAAIKQVTAAEESLRAARLEATDPTQRSRRAEIAALQIQATAEAKLAEQQGLAGNANLQRIRAETAALKVENQAKEEALRLQILNSRGLDASGNRVQRPQDLGVAQRIRDFLGLGAAVSSTDEKVNRISFTFRRLFSIFAAFTIVRQVIQGFRNLVQEGLAFNAQLETTRNGIAGLIAATGDIRNSQGQQLKGMDAFIAAQAEADRQTRLLQKDALATATTFTDLAEAFQTALGPGLRAGLGIDQIRLFTREISLAASSLGLAQNQLSEEVRSILSGNITRNTRIAQVLSISNADIQRAKETGKLFDFLQSKLSVFLQTADTAANTLPGLLNRFRGSVQVVLGAGLLPLTDTIKNSLRDVLGELVTIDAATSKIRVNPQIVEVVKAVSGFLVVATLEAKKFVQQLTSNSALEAAKGISDVLSTIIVILSDVVRGAVSGVGLIVSLLEQAKKILASILPDPVIQAIAAFLRFAATEVGAVLGVLLSLSLVSKGVSVIWKGLSIGLSPVLFLWDQVIKKIILARQAAIALQAVNIAGSLEGAAAGGAARGAITATAGAAGAVVGQTAAATAAPGLISRILASLGLVIARIAGPVAIVTAVAILFRRELVQVGEALGSIPEKLREVKKELPDAGFFERLGKATEKAFAPSKAASNANLERQAALLRSTSSAPRDFLIPPPIKLSETVALTFEAQRFKNALLDALKSAKGSITGVSEAIETLKQKFKEFEDANRLARDEDKASAAILGLEGTTAEQVRTLIESRLAASRDLKDVQRETNDLTKQQAAIEQEITAQRARAAVALKTFLSFDKGATAGDKAASLATLTQIIPLLVQENTLREKIREAVAFQAQAELKITAAAIPRIEALAREAAFQEARANRSLAVTASHAEELRVATVLGQTTRAEALQAQIAVEQARIELSIANEKQRAEERSLVTLKASLLLRQQTLENLKPADRTPETDRDLASTKAALSANQQNLDLVRERGKLQDQINQSNLRSLELELKLRKLAVEQPITAGVGEGLRQAATEAGNTFVAITTATKSLVTGLSQSLAQTVASAFDPNSNFSLRAAISALLIQVGTQLLATVIESFLAQVLLAAFGLGLAGETAGAALGAAAVTWVPVAASLNTAASTLLLAALLLGATGFGAATGGNIGVLAAKHARGYAGGGIPEPSPGMAAIRPSGLDPRDRTLFWGERDEWVIPSKETKRVGFDAMENLRRGAYDPYQLRAALGLSGSRSRRTAAIQRSFAEGGPLSPASRAQTTPAARPARTPRASAESGGGLGIAVIAPSNHGMERLLAGGRTAALQFLADNGFRPG